MSTTIETAGGSIGIAFNLGVPERHVILSLYLSSGYGISLRLTVDEARRLAAELIARVSKIEPETTGYEDGPYGTDSWR